MERLSTRKLKLCHFRVVEKKRQPKSDASNEVDCLFSSFVFVEKISCEKKKNLFLSFLSSFLNIVCF